jgi:hypothetical protein
MSSGVAVCLFGRIVRWYLFCRDAAAGQARAPKVPAALPAASDTTPRVHHGQSQDRSGIEEEFESPRCVSEQPSQR